MTRFNAKSLPAQAVLLVVSLGFARAATAGSLSPSPFNATIDVGETITVDRVVTTDLGGSGIVDFLFLADNTGSMSGVINNVRTVSANLLANLAGRFDAQFAVARYIGDPSESGPTFASAYSVLQQSTSDAGLAQAAINSWNASGGGDEPEANFYALQQAASDGADTTGLGTIPAGGSSGQTVGWRPTAQKVILWFGDASSHSATVTLANAIAALNDAGISVIAFNSTSSGFGIDRSNQASTLISSLTAGGALFNNFASVPLANIVSVIDDLVTEVTATLDLSLLTSGDTSGIAIEFTCISAEGCTDVAGGESRVFRMSVTGLNPGTYAFNVFAPGVAGASSADTVTVAGDAVATETPTPTTTPTPTFTFTHTATITATQPPPATPTPTTDPRLFSRGPDNAAALVVLPKVVADDHDIFALGRRVDTLIQITNTSSAPRVVHCMYMNATSHCSTGTNSADPNAGACRSRDDCDLGGQCLPGWSVHNFTFALSPQQPTGWSALAGTSVPFPGEGVIPPLPEPYFEGYLTCFVVDGSSVSETTTTPIHSNDLIVDATIYHIGSTALDISAYHGVGLASALDDGSAQDDRVLCLGEGGGLCPIAEYDACPAKSTLLHFFEGAVVEDMAGTSTTEVTFVPCTQNAAIIDDQPASVLQYLVFNEFEQRFSGSTHLRCFRNVRLRDLGSVFSIAVQGTLSGQTYFRSVPLDGSGGGMFTVAEQYWTDGSDERQRSAYHLTGVGLPSLADAVGFVVP